MTASGSARTRGRPTRTGGPTGRERLLAAARTEFAHNGLAGASVERIVAAAGVGAPTLYHHFGSKAGLFVAAAAGVYEEVVNRFETVLTDDQTFAQSFDAVLRSSVPIMRADPGLSAMIGVVQTELKRDPALARSLRPATQRFRAVFDAIAAKAPPSLCAGAASRRHLALALITIITGLNAQAPLLRGASDYEHIVRSVRRLIATEG